MLIYEIITWFHMKSWNDLTYPTFNLSLKVGYDFNDMIYMISMICFHISWNHDVISYMKSGYDISISYSMISCIIYHLANSWSEFQWNNIMIPFIWFQWYDFIHLEIMMWFHIWNLDMISRYHIVWFHVLYII